MLQSEHCKNWRTTYIRESMYYCSCCQKFQSVGIGFMIEYSTEVAVVANIARRTGCPYHTIFAFQDSISLQHSTDCTSQYCELSVKPHSFLLGKKPNHVNQGHLPPRALAGCIRREFRTNITHMPSLPPRNMSGQLNLCPCRCLRSTASKVSPSCWLGVFFAGTRHINQPVLFNY